MGEKSVDFRLYLITDRNLITHHLSFITALEDALKAGVKAVQLREKDLPTRELLEMAYRMRKLTRKYDALLFVNDRVDIALCVNADGVHLGQSSIPVHAARKVLGRKSLIGVSTHSMEEALAAESEGADFITFGPVYATPSKLKYGGPVGVASLEKVTGKVSLPVFGIGGVKLDNARQVFGAGAFGVAVISGILGKRNIMSAAEEYLNLSGSPCVSPSKKKKTG